MVDATSGIIRTPTEEERRDYTEIGVLTPREKFMQEVSKVEMGFIKNHLPFDRQCALIDFSDEIERTEKESERVYGYVRRNDVEKMNFRNLEEYGDEKRFEKLEDEEVFEPMIVNGIKTSIKTGHMIKYKCKRGHGVAVFVPNDVWENRKKGGK